MFDGTWTNSFFEERNIAWYKKYLHCPLVYDVLYWRYINLWLIALGAFFCLIERANRREERRNCVSTRTRRRLIRPSKVFSRLQLFPPSPQLLPSPPVFPRQPLPGDQWSQR